MQKTRSPMLLLAVVIGVAALSAITTGCDKETESQITEEKVEAATEHPASAKPKDHPAH